MKHLSIDIETKSSVDITKSGLYKYAESDDFTILLFAYKKDDDDVGIVDLAQNEKIPEDILSALTDSDVVKHAYNAAFEWYCLKVFGLDTPIEQWHCTMAHSLYCGYIAGLDATGEAIGLPQDKRKLSTGKALIKYFCTPQKPTKSNGNRVWNLPHHDLEKWELFKTYCKQDVVTENSIAKRLSYFPMPESEQKQWQMDVLMNAYGVKVDKTLIDGALTINAIEVENLTNKAMDLTGLKNPNSGKQLIDWLVSKKVEVDNIRKDTVSELIENTTDKTIRDALKIRQQLGKTSIAKYEAMKNAMGKDERVRGISQYYGANRTGRWAGRIVQLQNLPRNHMGTLSQARKLVQDYNYQGLKLIYGNVADTLSQLIRTAFIPTKGRKIISVDFSAIEARVIAWLAGEQWVNEVFATHGKIYEATASQMFGVPIEKIKKGNPEYELRQKGKVATLALGYQGGVAALIAMGALRMGLSEDELPEIVERWRSANPRIKDLWYKTESAAVNTLTKAQDQAIQGLIFRYEGELQYGQTFLTVQLPSGRKLFYPKPFLKENRFGKMAIHYRAVGQQTKKWEETSTYGGKLTENIVQAIARDCLAETLRKLNGLGHRVVFHVHDEVVVDAPLTTSVEELCEIMSEPISWAKDLVLKGAGFEAGYYMKD